SRLSVEGPGRLLARQRVLHLLPVLTDDAQVAQPRGHLAAAARHVRVVPVLAALTRFTLDPHIVGVRPQSLRRLALGILALALAGKESLALAEVLVVGPAATAPPTITIGAPTPLRLPTPTPL